MNANTPPFEPQDILPDHYRFFRHAGPIFISMLCFDIVLDDRFPVVFQSVLYKASFTALVLFILIGYVLYHKNRSINGLSRDFWMRIIATTLFFGLLVYEQIL
jgi:hypothetical protein